MEARPEAVALDLGRAAIARSAWREAYEQLSAADQRAPLLPDAARVRVQQPAGRERVESTAPGRRSAVAAMFRSRTFILEAARTSGQG